MISEGLCDLRLE